MNKNDNIIITSASPIDKFGENYPPEIKGYLQEKYILNKGFYEEVKDLIICADCKCIIICPKTCKYCQNNYCTFCPKNKKCLKCDNIVVKSKLNNFVKELLSLLIFRCPLGCEENFSYKNYVDNFENFKKRKCEKISYFESKRLNCSSLAKFTLYFKELENNRPKVFYYKSEEDIPKNFPSILNHPEHGLVLIKKKENWKCLHCKLIFLSNIYCYSCTVCKVNLCLDCVKEEQKKK